MSANQSELKGAISKASPELYAKVVDWCARWKARLEREAEQQSLRGETNTPSA
ncbi:hypothetical protein [Paenibacillus cymbidii]|uniref:hypothetical protein n=1 Tax=Paenibacillus cymbidii TaxID=1639034 RepID=UPI001436C5CB|nr:hypothetical protein [Paenibacillus cymbidii]